MTDEPPILDPDLQARLDAAGAELKRRYPGESQRRQPVHTVYGGAHLFRADTAARLGEQALQLLEDRAPDPETFAKALKLPARLASKVHARVIEKLRREPVEDYRIDFEDGYGVRSDAEEDGHADSAARELAGGIVTRTLPPSIGIRVKPLSPELASRSIRTLARFVSRAAELAGRLPDIFVVSLAKVTSAEQVAVLTEFVERLEEGLGLPARSLAIEIMVETPQSVIGPDGAVSTASLVAAAGGRCIAAHFGTYDYTASLNVTAAHQSLSHPACDFARHAMQAALAGTGVWISDGATNVLPLPPHFIGERTLTKREIEENRKAIVGAWKLHYDDVRRSLANAFYQGWDLHPAQLPTRYAANYAFFLEGLDAASARLRNFVEKAAQATHVGEVFDDAATGQGLLATFLRAWSCGAITEQEAVDKSGLTIEELESRSFVEILRKRRAKTR